MKIREIILDTETTGLNPKNGHRIIEIGALEMINKTITGNSFHRYINPEVDVSTEAYKIHGISNNFLRDKPLFKDIASDFISFIGKSNLVIHNAPFDIGFLNHELTLLSLASLDLSNAIDTLVVARKTFPGARASLDALCKRFKIDNSNRRFHGALKDAYLLSEVYVELSGGRQTSFFLREQEKKVLVNQNKDYFARGNKIVIKPTDEEKKKRSIFISKFELSVLI